MHLSGSNRGNTVVLSDKKISIGTDPSNNLHFNADRDKSTSSFHAEIELKDCGYILRDKGSQKGTLVNNRFISEITLKDGDLIEFGSGGPKLRFRIKTEEVDVCKPWSEMLEDSLGIALMSQRGNKLTTATTFFKQLLREAYLQAPHTLKIRFIIGLFIFLGILITYFSLQYIKLSKTVESVKQLEMERKIAENIIKNFSWGVCLIQGAFRFYDEETQEPIPMMGRRDHRGLNEYTGTGFLVSDDGLILTNRHVAEPWWELTSSPFTNLDPRIKPKFEVFRAFFPGIEEPFKLEVEMISEDEDVALLRTDIYGKQIPVLELDTTGNGAIPGEPVLLLGYPAGVKAIFAKTDPEIVRQLQHLPLIQLVEELSSLGLIRPLATQGHLSDVMHNRIVYDAQTTVGGSGGPIFSNKGKVIGINYGIFPGFHGSNFGVPITYGIELIQQSSKSLKD